MKQTSVILACLLLLLASCSSENEATVNDHLEIPNDQVELTPEQELESLNKVIRENPKSPNGYHRRHLYYIEQGEYQLAREDLNICINMSPETSIYYFEKAKLCYNLGEIDNSEVHAEKALELDSTSKDAHVLLGRIYLAIPNFGMALDELNAALRIDKNFAEPYFYKGMTYAIAGDTMKAVSSFITATEQYSDYYEAYVELGLIYAQHGGDERKLAEQYFNNALEIKPNSIEALLAKGIYCQDNEDYIMADSCYKLLLEVDPAFEVAYYNMGYVHLLAYRDDAPKEVNDSVIILALEDFSSAIEINDQYVTAYYNRGLCYSLIGDVNSAKVDYATAVKIAPDFIRAQQALDEL